MIDRWRHYTGGIQRFSEIERIMDRGRRERDSDLKQTELEREKERMRD